MRGVGIGSGAHHADTRTRTWTHAHPHHNTQITKTDKIKAMSKKQLRQIKKTQVGGLLGGGVGWFWGEWGVWEVGGKWAGGGWGHWRRREGGEVWVGWMEGGRLCWERRLVEWA